jgi:hypothetical protein
LLGAGPTTELQWGATSQFGPVGLGCRFGLSCSWQADGVSSTESGLPLSRASRLAVASLWAMVACGLVSGLGYVTTLPDGVVVTLVMVCPISVLGWAAAVFRDSRETGSSPGRQPGRASNGRGEHFGNFCRSPRPAPRGQLEKVSAIPGMTATLGHSLCFTRDGRRETALPPGWELRTAS